MKSTLLSGKFSTSNAEQLLNQLCKIRTGFHLAQIDISDMSVEDIKNSEKSIADLESSLKNIVTILKAGKHRQVAINANIVLEFCPDYGSV